MRLVLHTGFMPHNSLWQVFIFHNIYLAIIPAVLIGVAAHAATPALFSATLRHAGRRLSGLMLLRAILL